MNVILRLPVFLVFCFNNDRNNRRLLIKPYAKRRVTRLQPLWQTGKTLNE
jgi:hypothetical protein